MVLKNISTFFVLSQDEIDYLGRVAPSSKIKFQTMGIEEECFKRESKKRARKKLGLPLDRKIIVFIGRINPVKGVGYLLEAMKELKDIKLKIIGFGMIEKYKKQAKEEKLSNVEFLGPIFGSKKLLWLSAADALVLPSSKEGAPVSVMEALARNLPVVVSDVGGVRLMIKQRREGIIIQPRNTKDIIKAIREILEWKKDVREYGNAYKWEEIIKQTVKEYKRI
jgi:glycosyltransferase involved in cell wall biosynthesis